METQNNESCCCGSYKAWKSIAIILIILAVAGGAYYFGTLKDKSKTDSSATKQTEVTTPAGTGASTASSSDATGTTQSSTDKYPGWNTLTDTKMGYTLRYPTTWTAKIEDGVTDANYPGPQTSYHYASLAPTGQKWDLNIGIVKKGDTKTATSLRTGIGPVGIKTTGEVIKVAGSDVQIYEYVDNKRITEMFFGYAMGGSNTVNNDYILSGYFSYFGIYNLDKNGSPMPDASNTTTRNSEPYLSFKKILESIEFTNSVTKDTKSTSYTIYTNDKYGFRVSVPTNYKILTDKTNLYGWPNAVALLIEPANGKQSYDIAIEVWDSEAGYKKKYEQFKPTMVVKKFDGKFITFTDASGGTKNNTAIDQIASTLQSNK